MVGGEKMGEMAKGIVLNTPIINANILPYLARLFFFSLKDYYNRNRSLASQSVVRL